MPGRVREWPTPGEHQARRRAGSNAVYGRGEVRVTESRPLARVGWREWVTLPALGLGPIQAKVDTGAKTSALHAVDLDLEEHDGVDWVRFVVPPSRKASRRGAGRGRSAQARLQGWREVRSSNGRTERRPVIGADLQMGDAVWPISLTLTDRRMMGFRMLLGREALRRRVLVDPSKSFLLGKPSPP